MSQFIETAADVERELQEALDKLAGYEDDISDDQALERLAAESPGHPAMLMRGFFTLSAVLSLLVGVATLAFPFVEPLLDLKTRRALPLEEYKAIEMAAGFPIPVAFLAIAFFMVVGAIATRFLAVSIGREAPMLEWEAKEHAKLAEEVKRLTQQKNAIQRTSVTPAGARPRIATPAPSPRIAGPDGGVAGGGADAPLVSFQGGGGLPPAGGSLVDFGGDDGSLVSFGGGGPAAAPAPPNAWDESPTAPHYAVPEPPPPMAGSGLSGFGGTPKPPAPRLSTPGATEAWLAHALNKAELLANGFPLQARLEYSQERNMPFTLVLERATPAMGVRAMMSFVEFLANIPTPPRARVDLLGATVDRAFYRNVMSAVEPYFPDTCELEKHDHTVDLQFLNADQRWSQYPMLPGR